MEKVTVTAEDVRSATLPVEPAGLPPRRPAIPLHLKIATSPFVLALPALCLLTIAIRLAVKNQLPRIQLAWAQWLNSLLIASGLLTTLLFSMAYFVAPRPARQASPIPVLEYAGEFPRLPTAIGLSAQALSRETDSLVFVVSPELASWRSAETYEEADAVGSGVLLLATREGFLIASNRHVVDADSWLNGRTLRDSVLLFRKDRGRSRGEIVARHRELDLALVWARRAGGESTFVQPIAQFGTAETGQNVFVIGHPQRLFFSLSTGIIMRRHEEKMLQISAPVSPGNSGGPVYDEFGRLLAVVSFKVDRRFNPNAENLNFAVRADALLSPTGWDFKGEGEEVFRQFLASHEEASGHADLVADEPGRVPAPLRNPR